MPEATIDAMTYDDPGDGTHAVTADMPLQKVHKWTLRHSSPMPGTALMWKEQTTRTLMSGEPSTMASSKIFS